MPIEKEIRNNILENRKEKMKLLFKTINEKMQQNQGKAINKKKRKSRIVS